MSTEQLNAKKATLTAEIEKLKSEEKAADTKQRGLLDNMQRRFDGMVERGNADMSIADKSKEDYERQHKEVRENIDSADAEAVEFGEAIEKERANMAAVQTTLQQKVWASLGCKNKKCPNLKLVVEHARLSLLAGGESKAPGVQHALLVREVEKLERERATLEEAIQKGATEFARAQRRDLDQTHALGVKLRGQKVLNEQTEHYNKDRVGRLTQHLEKANQWRNLQNDKLRQLKWGLQDAEAQLKQLEDSMAACGC